MPPIESVASTTIAAGVWLRAGSRAKNAITAQRVNRNRINVTEPLLCLAANALADHLREAALEVFAELVVAAGFLADHAPTAAVARVEPFRGRGGDAIRAVEAHAGAHLDERPALRQLRRLFVFHADQGDALVAFEYANGTDGDSVSGFGLSNGAPVSGGQHCQADYQHRSQHDCGEDEEGLFQAGLSQALLQPTTLG